MSEITYRKEGDYLIPNLALGENGETEIRGHYGKYGKLRAKFLKEHQRGLYSDLLGEMKLIEHLEEIDREANERMDVLMKNARKDKSLPDQNRDPEGWAAAMNMKKLMAEEIVLKELIYV